MGPMFLLPPRECYWMGNFISIKAYQKKIANTSVLVMRQLGNGLQLYLVEKRYAPKLGGIYTEQTDSDGGIRRVNKQGHVGQ